MYTQGKSFCLKKLEHLKIYKKLNVFEKMFEIILQRTYNADNKFYGIFFMKYHEMFLKINL